MLVVALTAGERELGGLIAVELAEGVHHGVLRGVGGLGVDGLEEPAADDLEALLGAGRPPGGFHAAEGITQAVERRPPGLSANLDVAGRNTGDDQSPGHGFRRFGERLGEAHVRVEAAAGQAVEAEEVARVGHPFVDQDERGGGAAEQLAQGIGAGAHRLAIRLGHERIAGRAEQLPGHLAPHGAHDGAVGLGGGLGGREGRADQHGAPRLRQLVDARLGHHDFDAGEIPGGCAADEVVERQHGVRFAAAEIGL